MTITSVTYTGFVHTEPPSTPDGFKMLINKIRDKGIAILIVHHANSSNEVRGLRDKLDQLAFKFRLSRKSNNHDNLEAPITVTYEETRCDMTAKMKADFQIYYSANDQRWHLHGTETEAENLNQFKRMYKKSKYLESDICQMLGFEKSTYHNHLKSKEE